AAAFRSTTPRRCSVCRDAPSTTAFVRAVSRRFGRWVALNGFSSSRCRAPAVTISATHASTRRRTFTDARSCRPRPLTERRVNVPLLNPRRASRVVVAAGLAAFLVAPAAPVGAAHRARLSADLADHLNAGSSSISVIVHGTKAEGDALASRYNLVVKRRMKSGAVLQVTAG